MKFLAAVILVAFWGVFIRELVLANLDRDHHTPTSEFEKARWKQ